jgi:hypothetical protein
LIQINLWWRGGNIMEPIDAGPTGAPTQRQACGGSGDGRAGEWPAVAMFRTASNNRMDLGQIHAKNPVQRLTGGEAQGIGLLSSATIESPSSVERAHADARQAGED